jgi:DNA helicase-2/ATP-dependent DNA helicase PcrA
VSVLLHNELRDDSVEELLEAAQSADAPAPEPDA